MVLRTLPVSVGSVDAAGLRLQTLLPLRALAHLELFPPDGVVVHDLVPHRVEVGEGGCQRQAENASTHSSCGDGGLSLTPWTNDERVEPCGHAGERHCSGQAERFQPTVEGSFTHTELSRQLSPGATEARDQTR